MSDFKDNSADFNDKVSDKEVEYMSPREVSVTPETSATPNAPAPSHFRRFVDSW